uniref:Uncharacterized protein n=1 Tax=Octopus bimaculoides TaxID=37653 RepID=A0A0L8H8W2_OCTBM
MCYGRGRNCQLLKRVLILHSQEQGILEIMTAQEDKRQRMCDLVRRGSEVDPKRISNIVGVSLRTVCNVKKRMDMGNGIQRKCD